MLPTPADAVFAAITRLLEDGEPEGVVVPPKLEATYIKDEIVIDPNTYRYMRSKEVAVMDHIDTAAPAPRPIKAGRVLNWQAVLGDAIAERPGQLP